MDTTPTIENTNAICKYETFSEGRVSEISRWKLGVEIKKKEMVMTLRGPVFRE